MVQNWLETYSYPKRTPVEAAREKTEFLTMERYWSTEARRKRILVKKTAWEGEGDDYFAHDFSHIPA